MTHKPRQQSESGFYHVVTKGDGAQIVFESDRDRIRYLQKLADACDDFGTIIHAYCLMSNHVHLLVQDPKQNLGYFMKQLNYRSRWAHLPEALLERADKNRRALPVRCALHTCEPAGRGHLCY